MMENFDDRAKQELMKYTEPHEDVDQEIWRNIEMELSRKSRTAKKKKRRKHWIPIGIAAAIVFIFLLGTQTETGMAVVDQIKVLFEPEKKVIQEIEGQQEETEVHLNEGTNAEYVLYIDESRYTFIKGDEADRVTTKEPLPDQYPEVSMEIRQVPDVLPDDLVAEVANDLKKEFPDLLEPEYVTEPVEGYQLHGIQGQEWDSPVVHAYVISNGKSGSFVITERYFLEAAEGHGARFFEMLKEFQIVGE